MTSEIVYTRTCPMCRCPLGIREHREAVEFFLVRIFIDLEARFSFQNRCASSSIVSGSYALSIRLLRLTAGFEPAEG